MSNVVATKRRQLQEKAAAEEAEQQRIDAEYAAKLEEERVQAITRANNLLFAENDRIKTFNSKMLQADVLKERQMQQRVQAQLREEEQRQQAAFHAMGEEEALKEALDRKRRIDEQQERNDKTAAMLRDQREAEAKRKVQDAAAHRREGVEMRKQIEIYEAELDAADLAKRAAQAEKRKEFFLANKEIEAQRAEIAKLAIKEEAKVKRDQDEQDRIRAERKAHEIRVREEKQAWLQEKIDRQFEEMERVRLQEEARLSESERSFQERQTRAEEDKRQAKRKQLEENNAYHRAEHARREKELALEKKRAAEDLQRRLKEEALAAEEAAAEAEARRRKGREVASHLESQMEEKRREQARQLKLQQDQVAANIAKEKADLENGLQYAKLMSDAKTADGTISRNEAASLFHKSKVTDNAGPPKHEHYNPVAWDQREWGREQKLQKNPGKG